MIGEVVRINLSYKDAYITIKLPPQKSKKIEAGDIVTVNAMHQDKRTLKQNAFLWARIRNLNETLNGGDPDGEMDIYIELLERAGAKAEYIIANEQTACALRKVFRAVKLIGEAPDGLLSYKCYYGSSNFNTEEMARLLDELTEIEYEVYTGGGTYVR